MRFRFMTIPRFRRDFRIGLRIYSWVIIWKWFGKWHQIGSEDSYSAVWNEERNFRNLEW